ncbi:MAG: ACP phosphodiesterase [Cytophagales bacterium]|nr:ACP phosphodiesterase [Cytophagales bacterium]
MNFLAHLYLSGSHPERMIGNFIGDFVRGRDLVAQFGAAVAEGIELHRAIDEYTDKHLVVKRSKDRLRPKYRHYAPVIVDVYYDHFLASLWGNYHAQPLADYAQAAYRLIEENEAIIPQQVKNMMPYMMKGNWLLNYASIEGINRALTGLSRRTSHISHMEEAAEDLRLYYADFKIEFEKFFPELKKFCEDWIAGERLTPRQLR